MFVLADAFDRNRFNSALVYGTQVGLAGSMAGVRDFLEEVATVTSQNATLVLDSYDPDREETTELLGYRPDQSPGLAYREFRFEYAGVVGEPLRFRMFGPNRLRESARDAGWEVVDVVHGSSPHHYVAALANG